MAEENIKTYLNRFNTKRTVGFAKADGNRSSLCTYSYLIDKVFRHCQKRKVSLTRLLIAINNVKPADMSLTSAFELVAFKILFDEVDEVEEGDDV